MTDRGEPGQDDGTDPRLDEALRLATGGPPLDEPTRYGSAGRLARRLVARATRNAQAHHRGALVELVDAMRAMQRERAAETERRRAELATVSEELAETRRSVWALEVHAAVLRQATSDPAVTEAAGMLRELLPELREVHCDAGALLFPAHDQYMLRALELDGVWEPEEAAYLRSRLSPGMTMLDVGANVGYHALLAAQTVGATGRVIAIEPEPVNFACLCANIDRNRAANILPVFAAAAEKSGRTLLTRSLENTGDHRAYRHEASSFGEVLEVPAVAIDDLCALDEPVHLFLVDTQGSDHQAIAGATALIQRFRPPMVVEFWPPGIRDAGDDPAAVINGYRALGYHVDVLEAPETPPDRPAEQIVAFAEESHGNYISLLLEPASRNG